MEHVNSSSTRNTKVSDVMFPPGRQGGAPYEAVPKNVSAERTPETAKSMHRSL